jgi:hypothetical protein
MPDWVVTLFVALSGLLYLFSKLRREYKGLPSTEVRAKIPLSWALAAFVLLFLFTSGILLFFHLHDFPVPSQFWFLLVVISAAIVVSGIILIRRKEPEYVPPEERKVGKRFAAILGVLVIVMPILGFGIRALQRKFGL